MDGSILEETKKALGISPDDSCFDLDVIIHINSALATLTQLGVGLDKNFSVLGSDETWGDFVNQECQLNFIKNYVFLKTKMMFDPPGTSFVIEAIKNQISELEWRLLTREEVEIDGK